MILTKQTVSKDLASAAASEVTAKSALAPGGLFWNSQCGRKKLNQEPFYNGHTSSTTAPVSMSCTSAALDGALPLSPQACPLISFEAPSAPAPGVTLPPPSAAPADLPPASGGPPAHSSPAPGGEQPPPFDPEEEEELKSEQPCVVCIIARTPPPAGFAKNAAIEFILDRADADDGDPLGMLESVLYCDKHRVMI